jgi:RNA polymerase sigma-70 factor (ECF subfamily)
MAIVAALQALPVAERRAIVLHHVAGLSVVDVASELRAPEGTVKSWLSRGRSRLASELDRPEQQCQEQQSRVQRPRTQVAPPDVVVDPRKDSADD